MKAANSILSSYGVTVFETISRLAIEHDAINLGQGFPDEDGPEILRQIAAQATLEGPNQYPPMLGIPELRQDVAIHNKRFYNVIGSKNRQGSTAIAKVKQTTTLKMIE